MTTTMFVKPRPGLNVLKPDISATAPETERFLRADGEAVPSTRYWQRMVLRGDVVAAEQQTVNDDAATQISEETP